MVVFILSTTFYLLFPPTQTVQLGACYQSVDYLVIRHIVNSACRIMVYIGSVKVGDLTIEVTESDVTDVVIRKTHEFSVSRDTLVHASPHFEALLSGKFKEAQQNSIQLKDDRATSMEVFFRVLHRWLPSYVLNVADVWHLIAAIKKYQVDMTIFNSWFVRWYFIQPQGKFFVEMLYPCWIFNHHSAFMDITKWQVYDGTRHIAEENPTDYSDLHLPPRIMGKSKLASIRREPSNTSCKEQLKAARCRLRLILHRDLYAPKKALLESSCPCKGATLLGYEKALTDIKVFPLEETFQSSNIYDILSRLGKFSYEPEPGACSTCLVDYKVIVERASQRANKYFQGLCINCIDKSSSGDIMEQIGYFDNDGLNEDKEDARIEGCQFPHGQPTSFFSFMGSVTTRDRLMAQKRRGEA